MSPEVFWTLIGVYIVIHVVLAILFAGDSNVSQEEQDRRRVADDVNRLRQLQDIQYYKEIFRNRKPPNE
jgi:hypothetical protein